MAKISKTGTPPDYITVIDVKDIPSFPYYGIFIEPPEDPNRDVEPVLEYLVCNSRQA